METLRVEGSWVGVIEAVLVIWTVDMLRAAVANRLGCYPHWVRLLCSNGVLNNGVQTLSELGIRNNARILANRINIGRLDEQHFQLEDWWCEFARIREGLEGTEREPSEKELELGSSADQKAALLGLMIHSEAKLLIRMKKYNGALELLYLAERTFSLCNKRNFEMYDNMVLLNIETVWCYFLLRAIPAITATGDRRLKKARDGLEAALEGDISRITRFLRGVPLPEIALTMKLELLEGVVAYHNDRLEDAKKALESAREKYLQLNVPEDSSSYLQSMGYNEHDVNMALRLNGNKLPEAAEFLAMEAENRAVKQERQSSASALKKIEGVDLLKLKDLICIGFDMFLSTEAMRKNNNDNVKAFTDLTNPRTSALLEEQQVGGIKRRRMMATAPVAGPDETSFEVEWPPSEDHAPPASPNPGEIIGDSSDESEDSSDNDSTDYIITDDEEERVDLVEDVVTNVLEPANYDTEYRDVGVGIYEYLDLVAEHIFEAQRGDRD